MTKCACGTEIFKAVDSFGKLHNFNPKGPVFTIIERDGKMPLCVETKLAMVVHRCKKTGAVA